VGRSSQVSFALAATLGLSGCLLFSDPINKAPTVTIAPSTTPIYRDTQVSFTATVKDDHDPVSALVLRWHEFPRAGDQQSCLSISPSDWPKNLPPYLADEPYSFESSTPSVTFLCAQVTDTNGATGQACYRIEPQNVAPKAIITDVSGAPSNQQRPLCSQIHLSAENSMYPTEDQIGFRWNIQYAGTNSAGSSCDGVTTNAAAHRCFNASAPGTYTVTLTLDDTPPGTSAKTSVDADPFVIPVADDMPPCLRRTDPDVYAQTILLSRSADLGGYQSRTFKALSVDDDCEPYPPASGSTGTAQFVWSVLDMTGQVDAGSRAWAVQTNSSDSLTLSQSQFPNARPGDTVKVRLEVRDAKVQSDYQDPRYSVCPDSTDICTGANNCVRWTTWTVQFQP